jgi:hypothetical protein
MTTDAILAELRTVPRAPETLRERVRALPEPQPRFAWTPPRIGVRRAALVLAPAALALAVGSAALHGITSGGGGGGSQPAAVAHESAGAGASGVWRATAPPLTYDQSLALQGKAAPSPSTTRLNKYEAWLQLRVAADELSRSTTRAMEIARGYGGYVASVDMNTPGKRGTASLVLRVPVTKVEEAVLRLGRLGDVTAQHVRIQDLQRQANVQQRQIARLRATIASLQHRLANTSLEPAERVRLQYELDEAKRQLAQATKARAATVREGSLATVSMTFTTPEAKAAVPHEPSRVERTLRDAGGFLLLELAWLLYALVAVGPIVLLAAAAVYAVRAGRRRSDARLLEGA